MQKKLSAAQIEQNKQLQEKFDIRSFPTIILLDAEQQQIGVTGYRPGGGKPYAEHLKKMMNDYSAYKGKVKTIAQGKLSSGELKHLLRKAQEFNRHGDQIAIIEQGMKSDRTDYFMIERYRLLANEGKIHDKEAVSLREQLRKFDTTNEHLTHYQLACIEFHAYANEMAKENYSPDIAVAPLMKYVEDFGSTDREHLWRIHMIISQVYGNQNQQQKAIAFAERAKESAPEETKQEIALVIENYKKNTHSLNSSSL
jgi:protein disulfide-isomerase